MYFFDRLFDKQDNWVSNHTNIVQTFVNMWHGTDGYNSTGPTVSWEAPVAVAVRHLFSLLVAIRSIESVEGVSLIYFDWF